MSLLRATLEHCEERDRLLAADDVARARAASVFEPYYRGGQTGTSSVFLLAKLEFAALSTAENAQEVRLCVFFYF